MGLDRRLPTLFLAAVAAALPAGFPAARAGPAAEDKGGVFPVVQEVTKEDEASALHQELANAIASGDEKRILAAVTPLLTKRHKSFVDDLKKLVGHRNPDIAAAATAALGSQGDKGASTVLSRLATADFKDPVPGPVRAAAIESLGRLGVAATYEGIRKVADGMLQEREMKTTYAPAVFRACIRYFGLLKEKRAVSFLVGHVERPNPDNPASGTNPPASYWEARHHLWVAVKVEVVWALKEITGKEFDTERRWNAWMADEGKKQGYK